MKIFSVNKIREADQYTIENEPVKSIDLMERAASKCYNWIKTRIKNDEKVKILAGPGNNGGDGLVIARLFSKTKISVELIIIRFTEKESPDFATNLKRLKSIENVKITELRANDPVPEFQFNDVIIDAIFGSGLSKPVKGFIADVIESVNQSSAKVISVDIPSGLFADKSSVDLDNAIIKADYTLTFQFPKLAFFLPENDPYVGNWFVIPIGLHKDFIEQTLVSNYYVEETDINELIRPRNKFQHKGNFGHGLLIAGSYGKIGAAVLAAEASLRAGAGLIHCHLPKKGYEIMQIANPEVMISIDDSDDHFSYLPDLSDYNAIATGPGLGMDEETMKALKLLIQNTSVPVVFDADAINILAENKTWLSFLTSGSVFTPHPKEFERLVGKWSNDFEKLEMQKEFAFRYQCYVILKGAYTTVATPEGRLYFNSSGNPGMATAGSGDVLTGIILGLLTQNYSSIEAALIGVFLHGLAGDIAAKRFSQPAMLAGDIVSNIGKAYKSIFNG